jgi:hypothetical protein
VSSITDGALGEDHIAGYPTRKLGGRAAKNGAYRTTSDSTTTGRGTSKALHQSWPQNRIEQVLDGPDIRLLVRLERGDTAMGTVDIGVRSGADA